MFLRRLGPDPHAGGAHTIALHGCPQRHEVLDHHGSRPFSNDRFAPEGLLTTGFPLSGESHFSPPYGGSAFTGKQSAVRASSESNQTRSNPLARVDGRKRLTVN